jgi:hypothetical protein
VPLQFESGCAAVRLNLKGWTMSDKITRITSRLPPVSVPGFPGFSTAVTVATPSPVQGSQWQVDDPPFPFAGKT